MSTNLLIIFPIHWSIKCQKKAENTLLYLLKTKVTSSDCFLSEQFQTPNHLFSLNIFEKLCSKMF